MGRYDLHETGGFILNKKGNRDLPIKSEEEDLFHLQNYYRGLADFIDGCETPLTIALQGDWGSGKTSMMNNIAARLKEHTIIKFNTWQYAQFSGEADLPIALLGAITKEVRDQLGAASKAAKGLKDKLSLIQNRLHFNLSCGIPNLLSFKFENDSEKARTEDEDYYDSIRTFHDEFGKAVKELVRKKKKSKIVVFIDDLDRLHPSRAVELLEVIKIFLDVEGCVFVLSIDYDVVILGIEAKYGGQLMFQKGKSFFDKMIQLPFQIPVNFYKMDQLLNNTFERMGISLRENSQFAELIQKCIGSNPRTVKRLLNSFELLVDILEIEKEEEQEQKYLYLLFILILQLYNEHLYRYFIRTNKWSVQENATRTIFDDVDTGNVYRDYLQAELLDENERTDTFSFKKTISFIETMNTLLGEDKIIRAENMELFQSLLHQSQVTSSGPSEIAHTGTIELNKNTELTNIVIQGIIIDNHKEIPVSTFRDAFIHILETLIDKNQFKAFVESRSRTEAADLPDRIFSQMDQTSMGSEYSYHQSSVKKVHGFDLVLHYGRADLKRYLFKFLDAFEIQPNISLRVVEME